VRHDFAGRTITGLADDFNPRAYVRHDPLDDAVYLVILDFNPRAYVRHDSDMGLVEIVD